MWHKRMPYSQGIVNAGTYAFCIPNTLDTLSHSSSWQPFLQIRKLMLSDVKKLIQMYTAYN